VSLGASGRVVVDWYEGPRASLRHLFELADDSSEQIDAYITLGRVLVAGNDLGEIVGHLQLIPTPAGDTVELKSIAVLPDLQRCGIGGRLVAHALAICREEGIRVVTVTTATADIANLRFYQRLGFRATTIERDAFTVEKGYPPLLEADGIPVRDSITFTLPLDWSAG
jgi:ribosomal protein S18 acetylase RimI-like enzyme